MKLLFHTLSPQLSYPPTKNILSSLDGDELVSGLFVINLLNGDILHLLREVLTTLSIMAI